MAKKPAPRCIIIAGPNGAGKTTFARSYLVQEAGMINFINADLIATGLSPLMPERAARAAGRILLEELGKLTKAKESFALESTLSGKSYVKLIQDWKRLGYHVQIIFLKLGSPKLAVHRVAMRVLQGGHDVPRSDILRRFNRGLVNFRDHYQALADHWMLYDASGAVPVLLSEHRS
ncbi:MAG: zeta toxin family protein [Bacteroidetes bacterium]|nr:zeta toxin family protein [Bacteroidota bacterium]